MKGLSTNEAACSAVKIMRDKMTSMMHDVYAMGYEEGFADGSQDALRKLVNHVLSEVVGDENV